MTIHKLTTSRRALRALVLTAAALLLVALPAAAAKAVDESVPANPDVRIHIESLAGRIQVSGWGSNEVRVTGTAGDDTDGVSVRGDAADLHIEVEIPEGHYKGHRDLDADLEISVPAGARIEVETVSAGITVDGVAFAEAESVSGRVEVTGGERVEAGSVSGDVKVTAVSGPVSAETVSGKLEISGVERRVEASTVSGEVHVSAGLVEEASFESVSGSVYFEGGLAAGGRLDAECHSGTVDLAFDSGISADFSVETFSGRIDNRLTGDTARRTSEFGPGYELEFSTGGGGRVEVESFSGTVILRTR